MGFSPGPHRADSERKQRLDYSPRAVLWRLVQGDVQPGKPTAVTGPAGSQAINALVGTKRGSPRVVPDETKLAITNCASRGPAKTFGAVGHCGLLSGIIVAVRRSSSPFFLPTFCRSYLAIRSRSLAVNRVSGLFRGEGTQDLGECFSANALMPSLISAPDYGDSTGLHPISETR